jgi:hypothetical protein
MHWHRVAFLMVFFVAGFSGCRRGQVAPQGDSGDTATHLGTKTEIDVAEWLKWPREKLAEQVQSVRDTALAQQKAARETTESASLLPRLRPLVEAPVFADAKYSARLECSRPTYFEEGKKERRYDADIALHLARFGDHEAAARFADPADKKLAKQIAEYRSWRNYPVEWTQLVGLQLQLAQLKLAHGKPSEAIDGATELVLIHKQLVDVLDRKAAAGTLGSALLSIGRTALAEAAAAWRDGESPKAALADDVDAALKGWGAVPEHEPSLLPGAHEERVARVMGGKVRGRTVVAQTEEAVRRSIDLLDLPVVGENVESVVAFLGADGKLVEFLFVYKEAAHTSFPEPSDLARPVADRGYSPSELRKPHGLPQQSFTGGGLIYEVTATPGGRAIGAVVRVAAEKSAGTPTLARDPRDFGGIRLDRSFERNRTEIAPEVNADKKVVITRAAAIAKVTQPATDVKPQSIVLERHGDDDLVDSVTIRWSPVSDLNLVAVPKLLVPLWAAFGPARIEAVEDTEHPHLLVVWENERTRLTFRLPYNDAETLELKATDRRGEAGVKERLAETANFDKEERAQRWRDDHRDIRLGRGLPGTVVEQIQLGTQKAAVKRALASAREARLTTLEDGGFNLVFFSTPAAGVTYWPRQMFVRFDKADKVAEVRVRYQDGSVAPSKDRPSLFDVLKKGNGAPEKITATWPAVWSDVGERHSARHWRWLDDRTLITLQQDAVTAEVILRDCPADDPLGASVTPLAFLSRGVRACQLGDSREEVLKRWKIERPTLVGDAVLLTPTDGAYDAVLAYFEAGDSGRLVKIQAQYRNRLSGEDASSAIVEAWRKDLDHLGGVRRQDAPKSTVLQAFSWHDEKTRVRIFGQVTNNGPRLYCEWRELPIPAVKTANR